MKNKLLIIAIGLILGCNTSPEYIFEREYTQLDNTELSLTPLKKNDFTLFVAFSNNCPVCKSSIPILKKIAQSYPKVGIVLFYPANQRDKKINKFVQSLLPKSVIQIKDKNKFLTNTLHATVTPQAFVINNQGETVYAGAINNSVFGNYRKNYTRKEEYLLNVLDTLVVQKKALVKHETEPVGCFIE